MCGFGHIEAFDVANVLGSLVDKSLAQIEPSGDSVRYRLLETIRQFAAERLVEQGEEEACAVADGHCSFFVAFAQEATSHLEGRDQIEWAQRLDLDDANLRRAMARARGRGDEVQILLRFGLALRRYWLLQRREDEGLAVLRSVFDDPRADSDLHLLGGCLVTGSLLARDVREAVAWTERARAIAAELDDERLRIEALAQHATATFFAGDAGSGIRFAEEALDRARALGDDGILGLPFIAYLLCIDELEPAKSEGLFTESIACAERSGDLLVHCILLNNAGVHALRIGDTAAARGYLEEGIEMAEKMGHADSHLGVNLGWTMLETDDPAGARTHFEAALRLSRLQGDLADVACSVAGMACLSADSREWRRASTLFGIADDLFQGIGLVWPEPEASHRNRSAERIVETSERRSSRARTPKVGRFRSRRPSTIA